MIAVVGDVLVDVVVAPSTATARGSDTASSITWRRGGAAANTAAWLAAVGAPVRLVGRVGADLAGRALAEVLGEAGVDCRFAVDADAPTGTVVAITSPSDRDMYTSRGAAGRLSPEDLGTGWLDGVRHLHLSGYALLGEGTRAAARRALSDAAAAGVSISVDPASREPLAAVGVERFLSWLPPGVLLTPNTDEAALLAGVDDPLRAAAALAGRVGEAVVTCGADGAVWSDGVQSEVVDAHPCGTRAVDPVGAGDAFTAGLLHARTRGASVSHQLAEAVRVAARAVGGDHPGQGR
ncbi:carbohydrate kinase family protein [Euzebya sp.]|uniref:carbohydrate kinase family protein n=1 Tax=Euzebya sp. TaxID=1971409 RepID=UPI00351376EA